MTDSIQPQDHPFSGVPFDLDELLIEVSGVQALEGTPLRGLRNRLAAALQELRRRRASVVALTIDLEDDPAPGIPQKTLVHFIPFGHVLRGGGAIQGLHSSCGIPVAVAGAGGVYANRVPGDDLTEVSCPSCLEHLPDPLAEDRLPEASPIAAWCREGHRLDLSQAHRGLVSCPSCENEPRIPYTCAEIGSETSCGACWDCVGGAHRSNLSNLSPHV
jgi:hypothetical protein